MIPLSVALAWLKRWWRIVASIVAIVTVAIATIHFWPKPKPLAPIVPAEVVKAEVQAEHHEGAAEVLEQQADAVGTRADAIEEEIKKAKPRPKAKPLEDESDEEVARDVADLLRALGR
jgi:hypothetical protein